MSTLKVKDLMIRDVVTVSPEMSVKDAALKLFEMEISGLPVVDEKGMLAGMITEKDLIRMALPSYFAEVGRLSFLPDFDPFEKKLASADKVKVKEIMRKEVVTVTEDEPIVEVARLMVLKQARRIPVVREGKLVGIISRCDIVREMARRSGILPEEKQR